MVFQNSDAPKYKQIMRMLIEEMEDADMKAHDRFHSESTLSNKFKVSIATIRMALKELIHEGLIYREHGRGTFVSPPTVKRQILIVGKFDDSLPARDFGIMNFTQSFISDRATQKRAYMPVALSTKRFVKIVPDLRHYYPNATCVLIFRDYKVVAKIQPILEKQQIPHLFYGSDSFLDYLENTPVCVYPEKKIIDLGVDHLIEEYGDNIHFVYSDHSPVFVNRFRHFEARMKAQNSSVQTVVLPVAERKLYDESLHEYAYDYLAKNHKKVRSIFCADDRFAILFHNAALRLGLKIPEDLSILGINDYPICDMVYPSLSSIRIPIVDDGRHCLNTLISKVEMEKSIAAPVSKVSLVRRLST